MRYVLMEKRLKDQIQFLNQKMSSNQDLLESMTLQQERQKTLAVELDINKKTAMQNEKANDKLKEQLDKNAKQTVVLETLNQNKQQKLQELEYKMKGFDLSRHMNAEKLIDLLLKQEQEIKQLKNSETFLKSQLKTFNKDGLRDVNALRSQLQDEIVSKGSAIAKINTLQK